MTASPDRQPVDRLRVAFFAGSLFQGGAEKQLTYMAQALRAAGVEARVYAHTQGEYYESILQQKGVPLTWVGQSSSPAARAMRLYRELAAFRPHIVQSTHFFSNLYAALAGRAVGALTVGSVRSNGFREVNANGRWSPALLRLPHALLINSEMACRNVANMGVNRDRLFVLPNVIDLNEFNLGDLQPGNGNNQVIAITVARLIKVKRIERFLEALALARKETGDRLVGVIAGDGPVRAELEAAAQSLGLLPGGVRFLGARSDVPDLLSLAHVFVLSSEHEGFPNAILEAMAACLPVITTPAGDAEHVVQHGVTGYVTPHDDTQAMARRLAQLASSPDMRQNLGQAGRERVEQIYSYQSLAGQLLTLYRQMAERFGIQRALRAIDAI